MSAVKKTVDQTANVVALADVTSLVFPLVAGRTYKFEFTIAYRTAVLTTGIALSVAVPAFTTLAATARSLFAVDGSGAEFIGAITASNDTVIATAVPVANTDYMAKVEGIIVPSANGNVQLRFASEVGASLVTIRAGSVGLLYDLG
jgi:hypothetical protein